MEGAYWGMMRPSLVERLLQHRVTLLVAPAGHGKSSLLSEVLQRAGSTMVRHNVSAVDRDQDRLLENLALAFGAPSPGPGGLSHLCCWLAAPGRPAGLALDGVEALVGAPEAGNLLGALMTKAPPSFRIVLAGRALPPIPHLARLRLDGAAAQVGARDLLLTEQESQAFLAATGGEVQVAELAGGWSAALRLLSRRPGPDWAEFFAYVESEIMSALPPEERRQLIGLAAVDDWSPPVYNWLMGRLDGEEQFRTWASLLPVDRQGRIHPLLRRYLVARLAAEPDRMREIHRKLSLWKTDQGEPDEALKHALAAEDLGLAVPLLRQTGARLLADGRAEGLETVLEPVPVAFLEEVPDLLLSLGEVLRRGGSPRRACRWLRIAAVGFAADGDAGGLYRAFCRLALAHADLGEWDEMQAALRHIEAEADGVTGRDRAEALRALAEYQVHLGQNESAADHFQEAAELFLEHRDEEGAATALAGLGGGALVALGRLDEALAKLREAQRLVGGTAACAALLEEVQLLTLQGRWAEAGVVIGGARPGSVHQHAAACWLQALLALQRGDLVVAKRWKLDGDQLVPADCRSVDKGLAVLAEGWVALAEGRPAGALAMGRQVIRMTSSGLPLLRLSATGLIEAAEAQVQRVGEVAVASMTAGGLSVECYGSFRLFHAGREVPGSHWGRAQVRTIVQFLLLQPGFAAPRESLLEVFWPDEPPVQSRARLRVALNRLRSALQPLGCVIETGTEVIRLPREAISWVDRQAFQEHLVAARNHLRTAPETVLEHCRAGRALYRGPLLADAYWTGVEEHRQRAHRELVELLLLWEQTARGTGRPEEAITVLEDLLAQEPGQEEATRTLMDLLIRSGRRGDAMRRYRELVRWLKEEMGLDPSPQTQALLRQALN